MSRWWHGFIAAVIVASLRLWRLFSFFTIQSNLIVLFVAVAPVLRPNRDGPVWRVVRLDSLLGIVITGLVFAIVLHLTGAALLATIGFHYISPWTTLAAWLLYIFIQGAFTDWYPYPFLDVVNIGLAAALRNAFFVLAIGVLLAVALKTADQKLPSRCNGDLQRR